jgi:hypothetical protein
MTQVLFFIDAAPQPHHTLNKLTHEFPTTQWSEIVDGLVDAFAKTKESQWRSQQVPSAAIPSLKYVWLTCSVGTIDWTLHGCEMCSSVQPGC